MPLRRKKSDAIRTEFEVAPTIAETRTRSRKLIVAGVILAVCAGLGSFVFLQRAQTNAEVQVPKVSVVVAARTIAARKPIEAGDLTVRQVPADPTNKDG